MKMTSPQFAPKQFLFRCWLVLVFSLPAALCAQDYSTPYVFSTFAGSSSTGATDGPGQAARFSSPFQIAADKNGNLYAADYFNHTIRKITLSGVVTTFAGSAGKAGYSDGVGDAARFSFPFGIAVDGQGNVYVADEGNAVIRKIATDGTVSTLAGKVGVKGSSDGSRVSATFYSPRAMAVDSKGFVFVGDGSSIRRISPSGDVITYGSGDYAYVISGDGVNSAFNSVTGLAVDASDNLYATDLDSFSVRKITPDRVVSRVPGSPALTPPSAWHGSATGIAIDANNNLYLSFQNYGVIRKISPNGEVTTMAGQMYRFGSDDGTGGAALFYSLYGLAVGSDGNIFIADSSNNTIRKMTPAGIVSTLAGFSYFDSAGEADDFGGAARFYNPVGVAVAPTGDIYVTDQGNETIRKITSAGMVATFAGKVGESGSVNGPVAAARFKAPGDLAMDATGNLYVADTGNNVVRKITPDGTVKNFADVSYDTVAWPPPLTAGIGTDAVGNVYVIDKREVRKFSPDGNLLQTYAGIASLLSGGSFLSDVAVDAAGTLYVSDYGQSRILKGNESGFAALPVLPIAPFRLTVDHKSGRLFVLTYSSNRNVGSRLGWLKTDGSIELIAGVAGSGTLNGFGDVTRFVRPMGLDLDSAGALYVSDGEANVIRKGRLASAPVITTQPQSQTVPVGSSVEFNVVVSLPTLNVGPLTFQWYFNGQPISGEIYSRYSIASAQAAQSGDYTVVVSNSVGSDTSEKAKLTVTGGPVKPPPASGGGGGKSGGGGAPSAWFFGALVTLGVSRWLKLRGFMG